MLVLLLLPYPTSYLQRNQWSTAKICDVCSENPVDYYSIKSIKWLQYISLTQNINIRHACNGREQAIRAHGKTYKVDGYCKETTTIYQFHGCYFHGCKNWIRITIRIEGFGGGMRSLSASSYNKKISSVK